MSTVEVLKLFDTHVHLRQPEEDGSDFLTRITLRAIKPWCCGVIAELNLKQNILNTDGLHWITDCYDAACEAEQMPEDFQIWLSIKIDQDNMSPDLVRELISFEGHCKYVKGVAEIKFFPSKKDGSGITTNSTAGVHDFSALQMRGIITMCSAKGVVCKYHGETDNADMLQREADFIEIAEKHLWSIKDARICAAHVSDCKMLEAIVKENHKANICFEIAPQHLLLTYEEAMKNMFHMCFPVAKRVTDIAYLGDSIHKCITNNESNIIWGSDIAPHLESAKLAAISEERLCGGVWTAPFVPLYYMAGMYLDLDQGKQYLEKFMRDNVAANFPRITDLGSDTFEISNTPCTIPDRYTEEDQSIVPMLSGEELPCSIA